MSSIECQIIWYTCFRFGDISLRGQPSEKRAQHRRDSPFGLTVLSSRHVLVEFAYPIRLSRLHRAPSPADKTLSGSNWIHEIKHDGYHNGSGVQQCDAQ